MAQSKVTLNEIMITVRELTFDRFIIPAFAIKQMGSDYFVSIDKTYVPEVEDPTEEVIKGKLTIYKNVKGSDLDSEELTKNIIVDLPFNAYRTLEDLMNALIEANIVVSYTPYFRGTTASDFLIQVKDVELTDNFTAFRRYFFSNEEIEEMIRWYYFVVLDIKDVELTDEIVGRLIRPSEKHLAIWVSYYLVGKRRLYEVAAGSIGQNFTDGSDYVGTDTSSAVGTTTTTQIGSVFTITEDPSTGYFYEDFNRVGSDNVLGDRYSFWYKLMLYLRDLLETQFGDYSLRKDNVIPGYISLQRELDFRSYYDSYPFTLSPLSRGILSKTP
jgi:hypothetical protein